MASSYTTNYNLDKYVGTDKPNLRDQYNAAMDKIDNALLAANTNATEAKAATLSFQGDLDAVSDAVSAEVSARQNADTALSGDIAANTTAINNEVSARQTAVSNEATARQNADTSLSTAISTEATARQDADTSILETIYGDMLVFGDSWIANPDYTPVQNCWIYDVRDFLKCTNLYCYAKASSGIASLAADGNSVYSQAQKAASELTTSQKNKIRHIFIMGGVQDLGNRQTSATAMQEALITTLSYIKSAFTKAKVYLFSPDIFFDAAHIIQTIARSHYWAYEFACRATNCVFLKDFTTTFLGYGQSVYRPNDDSSFSGSGGTYHPNNKGQKLIAQYTIQALSGNKVCIPVTFTTLNNFSVTENRSYTDGEKLYLDFLLTIPANVAKGFVDALDIFYDGYRPCYFIGENVGGGQKCLGNPTWLGNAAKPQEVNGSLWMEIDDFATLSRLRVFIASSYSSSASLTVRYQVTHSIKGF